MKKYLVFPLAVAAIVATASGISLTHAAGVLQNEISYYTANGGTSFSRSTAPFVTGVATQTANHDGSVTVTANSVGYADSGFVVYVGTLADLDSLTVKGAGDEFGVNLWFDNNNDGEFFAWNGDTLTSLGGDSYALGPSSVNGALSVAGGSLFTSLNPIGGNYTLSQLKSGAATGITGSTRVAVWVGVTAVGGSRSATIEAVSVNPGAGYGTMPGYAVANSHTVCAGHGAFGAFGKGENLGNLISGHATFLGSFPGPGTDGRQTGINNSTLCGNPQRNK